MLFTHQTIKLIIIICFIIKLILANYIPFLNDEAYTIAVAQQFSWSFFDHPPIGFWSSLIFSKFTDQTLFFYRLPFILYGLATTLMIYKLGEVTENSYLGLWSALLYNLAPFYFFSGSLFIVPDAPLNLGVVLVGYCLVKLHKTSSKNDNFLLLLLGFSLALCFASKYQGYLIGFGSLIILYFSSKKLAFLKNPSFYLCTLVALSGILPTLIWNHQNEWISFEFHRSRQGFKIDLGNFFIMLFASFLYLLPLTILLPINKLLVIVKNKNFKLRPLTPEKILTLLALPNIIIFTFVYMTSSKTFPHWIMPAWLLLLPIVSKSLITSYSRPKIIVFYSSNIIIWLFLGIITFHSQSGILTNYQKELPYWDNTLELINWRKIKEPVKNIIENQGNNDIRLAAFTWTEAGQFSTIMENKYETIVIEGNPHHFKFMKKTNQLKPTILVKLTLGTKPDTVSILKRLMSFNKNAQHIKNIFIKRGNRDYATASLFLF